eukprot:2317521-Pleurochrysis_carterae.AAC.2
MRAHRLLERVGVELPLSRGLVELERDWNHRRARQAHLDKLDAHQLRTVRSSSTKVEESRMAFH